MGDEWLVVDNSILAATAKCSTYAFTRYALGLVTRSESLALSAGSAIHAGLADWLGGASIEHAVEVMATDYEAAVSRHLHLTERDALGADEKRFEPEWVEAIFQQYLDRYEGKLPFKVLQGSMERPISTPLGLTLPDGRQVRFSARLDGIVRKWDAGGRWSLDHKSTRKVTSWWEDKQKVSSQFSGQVWIGRQTVDGELVGVIVNAIELPEPHRSERKCPEHKVSYQECSVRHAGGTILYITRSAPELEAWHMSAKRLTRKYARLLAKAEEGIEAVEGVTMEGRFNEGCVFCDMKDWCRLGRNTSKASVRATFKSEPWDPLALPGQSSGHASGAG